MPTWPGLRPLHSKLVGGERAPSEGNTVSRYTRKSNLLQGRLTTGVPTAWSSDATTQQAMELHHGAHSMMRTMVKCNHVDEHKQVQGA